MATSIARPMAARFRPRLSTVVQSGMAPSTDTATKAPSAMKTPWPKLSTSIRPKISVRPDAMMKMIMPIARPATVSVTQVLDDPTSGSAASASSGASSSGAQSMAAARGGASEVLSGMADMRARSY